MLSIDALLQAKDTALAQNKVFVVRLTADWCKPCRRLAPYYKSWVAKMDDAVVSLDINIDESLDVYSFFKRKRIVRGIPAVLAWVPDGEEANATYWPNDSVCSGALTEVELMLERVRWAVVRRTQETMEEV